MAEAPAVSVVIVTWNSAAEIAGCLESLAAHPPLRPWEAVVVDNASSDRTLEVVATTAPWARVIGNPVNRGLAAANNQGMAATTGSTIILSNPDVIYGPGALEALVDLLDRHPRAAFAVAKLLHPDGEVQTGAGDLPTLTEALIGRRAASARTGIGGPSGFWWHGWGHDEERPIGHGGEACYAVRRDALGDIGPQDEGFPLDWEGIDWSARALAAGWEVWFCPSAAVVHLGGTSIAQARVRWIVQSHRGMHRYFAARHRRVLRLPLAVLIAGRGALKLAATLLGRASYRRASRTPPDRS